MYYCTSAHAPPREKCLGVTRCCKDATNTKYENQRDFHNKGKQNILRCWLENYRFESYKINEKRQL